MYCWWVWILDLCCCLLYVGGSRQDAEAAECAGEGVWQIRHHCQEVLPSGRGDTDVQRVELTPDYLYFILHHYYLFSHPLVFCNILCRSFSLVCHHFLFSNLFSSIFPLLPSPLPSPSYFFLEFSTRKEAETAVATGNGYRLDKAHVFAINFFSDFDKWVASVLATVPLFLANLSGLHVKQ